MTTFTRVTWVAAAAIAATLIYFGVSEARRSVYLERLPALPDLSAEPSAVRTHLADADRTARTRPTSADAIGTLAVAYHADMFYKEAERGYAIAEELSDGNWRWTYYRALVHDAQGDAEALASTLRQVVAKAPDHGPAWWRLGDVEFKAGHYDAAGDAWRRVLATGERARSPSAEVPSREPSAPLSAQATLGLARIALIQGSPDTARELLESVTKQAPTFGPAFRLLGSAYAALGRTGDAERVVMHADRSPGYDPYLDPALDMLVRESRSSTFLLQQAATADLTINAAWREYLIRRALEFDPENTDAMFELASVLRVLRRFDEALPLLERHVRLVPGDFQVLADIGRCLSGMQRYAEAESTLRRALEGLDDANTRYDLGLALDRLGRLAEAIAEYQRALERNPNHRDALNNLGVAFARQEKVDEAARLFERMISIEPDNADAHANLGVVLMARGASDLAAREFREALRINPNHARARDGLKATGR